MADPAMGLLVALALVEARTHARFAPTDTCRVDGQPFPCDVRRAADAVRDEANECTSTVEGK
jgi:hypothetical protein